MEYDSLGNVTSVAQGQQVTRYEYDLLGRLTKVITPDGAETAYAYDALGNIIGETDPLGNTTHFAYTPENLLAQVTYANGATQRLDYDLAGNVTAETDGEGYTKHYKYDKVNRLTAVVDEAGNTTSYKYDALDNIAQVTDAMKHVTKYTYDKNGNLLTETDALGNTVTYTYTPEGWLSSVTKADGTVMTFEYDKTGNLTAQNTGENQSIENSYNEIGQVTTVKNSEGTIKYQYNQQGYLVSVTNVNGDEVSYAYDEYGNKTSMTYPDGRAVRYTYDSMNRMTSVTGLDGEVTTYAYDAAGRRVETASRTLTTEYRYDVVGSLVEQSTTGSSNIRFQYTYNLNGYITGEVRTENGATVESLYTYDPLGELTGFTQSTGYGEQYAYDKAGNMTAKTITGTDGQSVALKMTYNKGNQLVTMAYGKDKITYQYDKNGSMVQKVLSSKQYGKLTDTYAYNSLDQLVSYTGYDGYQQRFTYDANGMRLSKSEYGNSNRSALEELLRGDIAGLPEIVAPDVAATSREETVIPAEYEWATTEYLYDITQEYYQVIEQTITKDNTTTTTAYAYGVERIAAYDTNATTQYIYDGRGSVAQTISAPAAGTSVSAALPQVEGRSYSYTAFGEQMGSKTSGFAYNAEDYDAGTGMINLRMRQYEPAVGRFSQKNKRQMLLCDSILLGRYVYSINSPLSFIDPSGLEVVITMYDENGKPYIYPEKLEKTKKRIIGLADAANAGLSAMRNSTDEDIQAAVQATLKEIDKMQMEETDPLYEEVSNKLFAKNCILTALDIAFEYGKGSSTPLSYQETMNAGKRLKQQHGQYEKKQENDSQADYCIRYVLSIYEETQIFSDLEKLYTLWKNLELESPFSPLTTSSSVYGGLTGTACRALCKKGGERDEKKQDNIALLISVGQGEPIKIKLPGMEGYINLYDPKIHEISLDEQRKIVGMSGITGPLDIVLTNLNSPDNLAYGPDYAQNHGILLLSPTSFSGINTNVWPTKDEKANFIKGYLQKKDILGFDYIIVNKNENAILELVNEYDYFSQDNSLWEDEK